MRKIPRLLALVALAVAVTLGAAAPSSAQAGTGTVTVIHGIPGVTVDVYVNGDPTLEDFAPETVTDPLELPAGDYTIDVRAAGADPAEAPLFSGSASLPAGANVTLIAHLTEGGDPTLGVFVNDTAPTAAGEGRLVVRHTAAAPAVDVLAGGSPVISGLTNPNEETLSLPAATVSAAVAAAGTTDPVLGPVDVPVVAGQVTIVYAIGSLEDDSLGAVVQTLTVGEDAATAPTTEPAAPGPTDSVPVPAGVPSGDSGLAAGGGSSFPTTVALGIAVFALAGVVLAARSLSSDRS
jgi:hypothetical protein